MALVLNIQGWFYILTGLWPLVHMKSFELVSGPKHDKWLVKCVSLMILSSGIIFISYPESKVTATLALLNALTLLGIDTYYVAKKVIWKTYLFDGVIEAGFVMYYLIIK